MIQEKVLCGSIFIVTDAVYPLTFHTANWQETAYSFHFAWQGINGEKFTLLQTSNEGGGVEI